MKKNLLTLLVLCLPFMASLAQNYRLNVIDDAGAPLNKVSRNGKYIAGTYAGKNVVVNTHTGEQAVYVRPGMEGDIISDISDNGIIVGQSGTLEVYYPSYISDEEWVVLPTNDGRYGNCAAISADGMVIGGYVWEDNSTQNFYLPAIWVKENDSYELQILPYPEEDFFGKKPQGIRVTSISPDGNLLLGIFTPEAGGNQVYPIIWKKTETGYEYEKVGEELVYDIEAGTAVQDAFYTPYNMALSEDGRYIVMAKMYLDMTLYKIFQHALIIDLEAESKEERFSVLADPSRGDLNPDEAIDDRIFGLAILNDKTVFGATLDLPTGRLFEKGVVYDYESSSYVNYENWIEENYGIDIFSDERITLSGRPIAVENGLVGGVYQDPETGIHINYYIMEIVPSVTDFKGEQSGYNVELTWQAPEDVTFESYTIYRDGEILKETVAATETSYTDEDLTDGTYNYTIVVNYANGKKSDDAAASVTVSGTICPAVTVFTAKQENDVVVLTWEKPAGEPASYTISRGESKIAENITALTYTDTEVENETYNYCIVTNYPESVCKASAEKCEEITVSGVSISNVSSAAFELYPNPAKDNLVISGLIVNKVEIYNALGQKVDEIKYSGEDTSRNINVSKYQQGIYLFRIFSVGNNSVVKRITIVK